MEGLLYTVYGSYPPIVENGMENTIGNEMQTGLLQGLTGINANLVVLDSI